MHNIYVLYIIIIYALPNNGDFFVYYFCGSGYLMMFFTLGLAGFYGFSFVLLSGTHC